MWLPKCSFLNQILSWHGDISKAEAIILFLKVENGNKHDTSAIADETAPPEEQWVEKCLNQINDTVG